MARITILGAGMMGSALSVPMVDAGHQVRLVGTHLDDEIIESLKASGRHPTLKLELPGDIQPFFFRELDHAMQGAELIGVGVSSAGVRWAAEQLVPYAKLGPIVMITKGLELRNGKLEILPDVLAEGLGGGVQPSAIAGPCIAGELARRVESCVVVAGRNAEQNRFIASTLGTDYYHLSTSDDAVGVEVCAALKNAYAMGIAFADGLHEQRGGSPGSVAMHNFESAVFAQSVVEMQRVVTLLGGAPESVVGLAGVGDLDVTCNGGRTGRFGRLLGLGLGVREAVRRMQGATLECLDILQVMREALRVLECAGRIGPGELPLLRHMAEVALDDQPVRVPFERFFGG